MGGRGEWEKGCVILGIGHLPHKYIVLGYPPNIYTTFRLPIFFGKKFLEKVFSLLPFTGKEG